MPVLLLVLFGYGVSFDADHLPIAVIDDDGTELSRSFTEHFFASGEFERVEAEGLTAEHAEDLFQSHRAIAVMVIPRQFGHQLVRRESQSVQLLIDGVEANLASQLEAKAQPVLQSAVLAVQQTNIGGPRMTATRGPIVDVRATMWFNPASRSALFLVPGVVAFILAVVCVLLTSLTLAREYERGSIQQLFVTPVRIPEILLGKLLPYFALGAVASLLVVTAGTWIFDVPIRGSLPALVLSTTIFLICMLGQGLVISVVTKNQMVATQVATMTSMLPALLLSGFLFPIENMPKPLQLISGILPPRYFIDALRAILLRGNGFAEIAPDLVAMSIFALVMLVVGIRRFSREIA